MSDAASRDMTRLPAPLAVRGLASPPEGEGRLCGHDDPPYLRPVNHFDLQHGELHAESILLTAIAAAVGTPTYVYSAATLRRHFRVYRDAFAWGGGTVAYAVKANGNLSVLKVLAAEGAGADTVSEGEIRRALAAGVPPGRIIFSGMGKTDAELRFALSRPGLQINVESAPELERLSSLAAAAGARPIVVFRVNPGVGAGGHAKITTGQAHDKFGVGLDEAIDLYRRAHDDPWLDPRGVGCHIGSQITELAPFKAAWTVMRDLVSLLRGEGLPVSRVDLGGGLAVPYFNHPEPPPPADLGALARRMLDGMGLEVSVEPGRAIAANAGVLLSRVVQANRRAGGGPTFLVLDAAMNDLLRPTLYDAHHEICPVVPRTGEARPYDVVGPVCESGDTFARDRLLPPLQAGDLVAFLSAGAYGAAMASEYNSRPLAAEVLVDGDRWAVVRPRPTYDEMLGRETAADWLG